MKHVNVIYTVFSPTMEVVVEQHTVFTFEL